MPVLFELLPGESVVFSVARQAKRSVRRVVKPAWAPGTPKVSLYGHRDTDERVTTVLARACIGEKITGRRCQSKRILEFAMREQACIRSDDRATQLHLDAALMKVPFDHSLKADGGVMWDGKYLSFADQGYERGRATAIYRAKRARGSLIVVGMTVIRNRPCGAEVGQSFILGKKNTPANHEQGTVVVGGNTACYYTPPVVCLSGNEELGI
jgi:hypothetical protein